MIGRCMYVWKLEQVLTAEGGVSRVIDKARRAKLSTLWIKIADGTSPHANVKGDTGNAFIDLISRAHAKGLQIWGWHVPHCKTDEIVLEEVKVFAELAERFKLDGLIMDAEGGPEYFHGGLKQAELYGVSVRAAATRLQKPLAISSNDIPINIADWLPRFDKIAAYADYNFPQTYYGSSPSVASRIDRAARGNAHLTSPFVPVGAGWIGDGGGCASAQACAERANVFIQLCRQRSYLGCSFWHWGGAPLALWEVLNSA